MAATQKIRIRLKGYDHTLVDQSAERIVETAKRSGAKVSGPIPLPTKKEIVTILRAVYKYKDSREQFEMRTHKTVDAYGAENADETVYTYSLIAYDTQTDKVLTQKDLGNWDRECHGISNGETILLVRVDSMTQNTLLTLNTETLELEPHSEIPGQVQDVFGPYCCYDGDFAGTELGGTYLGWYVRNMDTGEAVHYDNDYYFCGFTEAGFLSRSNVSGSDPALVPYP